MGEPWLGRQALLELSSARRALALLGGRMGATLSLGGAGAHVPRPCSPLPASSGAAACHGAPGPVPALIPIRLTNSRSPNSPRN